MQNSAGAILLFVLYPPLFTFIVEFYSSSNVNIVEGLVSIPVLRFFLGSALTIFFG